MSRMGVLGARCQQHSFALQCPGEPRPGASRSTGDVHAACGAPRNDSLARSTVLPAGLGGQGLCCASAVAGEMSWKWAAGVRRTNGIRAHVARMLASGRSLVLPMTKLLSAVPPPALGPSAGHRRPGSSSRGQRWLNWELAPRAPRRSEVSGSVLSSCWLSSQPNLPLFLQNLYQEVYFSPA